MSGTTSRHRAASGAVAIALAAGSLAGVACGGARYEVSQSGTGGPALTLPAHFAEGPTGDGGAPKGAPAGSAAPAGSGAAAPVGSGAAPAVSSPRPSSDPDPIALLTANQWEYVFTYSKGEVRVASVRRIVLPQPIPTPRRFGRFAVELRIGHELIDRVRFDFPLLGGEPQPSGPTHPLHEGASFGPGAETRQRVLIPDSDRATAATLVDRLTGTTTKLEWPPPEAH